MKNKVVSLYDVTKIYNNDVVALNDINLEIYEGEFVFIIGPSGAGKSSLIKMLYLEEKPTVGDIVILNNNLSDIKKRKIPDLRRKIGCIFQDFKLLPKKTVFENISFVLEVTGSKKRDIESKVDNVLEKLNILDKKHNFPNELSGGQQQRVAIARALVNNPKIIIADEPTGNLDPETGEEVFKELLRINKEFGTTVIMTTHNQQIVDKYKNRVIEMKDGKKIRDEFGGEYSNE